jgi:hypothetical protein
MLGACVDQDYISISIPVEVLMVTEMEDQKRCSFATLQSRQKPWYTRDPKPRYLDVKT